VNESFAICHSSANAVTVEHSLMFDHLWVGWYISSQSARLWAEPGLRKHAKREASLNAVPISPDPQKSNLNPLDHPGGAGWSSRGATESTPYGKRATGQLLILQAWRQVFSDSSILEKSLCIFLLPNCQWTAKLTEKFPVKLNLLDAKTSALKTKTITYLPNDCLYDANNQDVLFADLEHSDCIFSL